MDLSSLLSYALFFVTMSGIYSILTLGLNVQWGFAGLANIGVVAPFSIGAYTTAIFTSSGPLDHVGGYQFPLVVALLLSMFFASLVSLVLGLITLRLRSDYFAIASIGLAEIVRLVLKNEAWLTGGIRGFSNIPAQFSNIFHTYGPVFYMLFVLASLLAAYLLCERSYRSPWGRALRALRENEDAARSIGKRAYIYRLSAFIFGSCLMAYAGGLYTLFIGFISPEAFELFFATFIVWVMLRAGGPGNNRGATFGAFVVWGLWSFTDIFISGYLPPQYVTQAGALRIALIGVLLIFILLVRPEGLFPEKPPKVSLKEDT